MSDITLTDITLMSSKDENEKLNVNENENENENEDDETMDQKK